MDKEHTRYGAGTVVISRAENGYIVTLRLWDNEVTLVSETFDGVVGILRRVDWSGVPRGERLSKEHSSFDAAWQQHLAAVPTETQTERGRPPRTISGPTPDSPDEGSGMAARAIRG